MNYHRQLVGKSRVVGDTIGYRAGYDQAVPVLVLQAFARERGATGGSAHQEAAHLHVSSRPGQVTDALKAEHRVKDIKRDHGDAVSAVSRARGNPGRHRAGFVDALFQYLPFDVLAVIHHLVGIHRLVQLAFERVNAELSKHAFHAKCPGLVRHDGHDVLADVLVTRETG